MDAVIDAELILMALTDDREARKTIINSTLTLCTTEFVFNEIKKYKKEILAKSKGTEEDFDKLLYLLEKNVQQIKEKELLPFISEENSFGTKTKRILYLACAQYKKTSAWSYENQFERTVPKNKR